MLFGEQHAAVARLPEFRVNRVTNHHPKQDGQRQCAHADSCHGRDIADPDCCAGNDGAQCEPWDKMFDTAMMMRF